MNRTGLALAAAALLAAAPAHAQRDTARAGTYELSAVSVMPRVLNAAELEAVLAANYPEAKREAGVSASVTVRLVVTAEGLAGPAEVVSSTDSAFNAPTLAVISRMRFSPAQVSRRPVAVWVEVPITWMAVPRDAPEPAAPSGGTQPASARNPLIR